MVKPVFPRFSLERIKKLVSMPGLWGKAREKIHSPISWYFSRKICKRMKFKENPAAKDFKPRKINETEAEEIVLKTHGFLQELVKNPTRTINSFDEIAYGIPASDLARDAIERVLLGFLKTKNLKEVANSEEKANALRESVRLLKSTTTKLRTQINYSDAVLNGAIQVDSKMRCLREEQEPAETKALLKPATR